MLATLVQLLVVGIWGTMFVMNTRRLLRLAQVVSIDSLRNHPLRHRLNRVWWWLGREEFWRTVQFDCIQCVQLTLMILLMAWGLIH